VDALQLYNVVVYTYTSFLCTYIVYSVPLASKGERSLIVFVFAAAAHGQYFQEIFVTILGNTRICFYEREWESDLENPRNGNETW